MCIFDVQTQKLFVMMKKIFFGIAAIFACCALNAQQLRTPAPSTTTTVKQDFALSSVELSYSRPSMKGRKIFGDLVPYDKVWRTGANQATTLTFGEEVMIGGTKLPAGKYGMVSIPGANEWTVIITKQTDITSPAAYKQENDVVRVKVQPMKLPFPIETFTISFDDIKNNTMNISLMWENTYLAFPVNVDVDSKVMAQIKTIFEGDPKPYFNAAMYYMDNGKDVNQALAWFDKALVQNPNAFWVHHQRANALAKLGRKQDAIAAANKSIELAKVAKNDDYVKLNEDLLKKLN